MDQEISEEPEKIETTLAERELLKRVLRRFHDDLRERQHPPKGMKFGEVQDALANSASLLAKLE